jgi:tetratricopeptide (TPR) repeat protein
MAKVKKFSKAKVIFQAKKSNKSDRSKNFTARLFPVGQKKSFPGNQKSLFIGRYDSYLSLGVGLILVILLGGYAINNTKLPLQVALAENPLNINNNLTLADYLIQQHRFSQAESVLRFAQQQEMKNKILGWATTNEDQLNQLWLKKHREDPADINRLITKWEKLVREKPDYRDGYIQLALLYQTLNNTPLALKNIDQALQIDPNNQTAQQIKSSLKI